MSKETGTVLESDVLFRFRLQLFDHAREVGVSQACRTFGTPPFHLLSLARERRALGRLERDLEHYLAFYDTERAHTGRYTQGRTPWQTLVGARKMRPR